MPDREALLELAKQACIKAGKQVLEVYDSGDFTSFCKDDNSPVTTADYMANEIICELLQKHTPDIPIMSEENSNEPLKKRLHWKQYWLIDPIDGTKEFIAQSGHFAINIGLVEDHEPVIGVIYWPTADTIYFASKGNGAFKQSPQGKEQIHVRQISDPQQDDLIVAISREQPPERVMSKMSSTRQYSTLALGSCSLKSCYVAEGKADVFVRLGITGEWDTGASQCIVCEAGGNIADINFEPLTYNQRDSLNNPDFIVTGDQRVNWQSIIK
ncbi:3'(2'),5'-bisphosphate nucleotidase CysQ [Paraneptunicella aestuarii]|uniref:3'(2'),5'-bisphosphate nucleotidase CysQ n=1 Tax=Paraneptunicella aestuarii TaxID=2831148 RepID=UPI001E64C62F|nr:3'(2'),5'-bisphosphate nucleotidase CysQ [Paraneptunicella aestuarii]UAA38902.1 3'(2'),5'-bisphosphate nucleotidase CysQ [Paraneptunicella aestuarii]